MEHEFEKSKIVRSIEQKISTYGQAKFEFSICAWIAMEYIRDRSCLDLVKSGTISLLWDLSPTWTVETWTLSAKAILRLGGLDYLHQERKDNIAMFKAASVLFCLMLAKSSYPQILASLAGHDFKADIWFWGITTIGLMIDGETQYQHTSNSALIALSNPHPLEASSWRCEWRRLVRDA